MHHWYLFSILLRIGLICFERAAIDFAYFFWLMPFSPSGSSEVR